MSPIESNLQHVRGAVRDAITGSAQGSATDSRVTTRDAITLVAVSKTRPAADVRAAFDAGQRDFGENYVQEAIAKITELDDLRQFGLVWHFIGPLQSNKAKLVAAHFDWVHGVDRLKIAEALSGHRQSAGGPPLNVCLQVNVSGEATKSGVSPPEVSALACAIAGLPALKFRGLMSIIENTPDERSQRQQFQAMHGLLEQLRLDGLAVDTLSMGMSQDFRVAIEEGATMVRIGSAIFGART